VSLCRKLCRIKLKLNRCSSPQFARITDFYIMVFTKISIGKNNVNIGQHIFSIWTAECSPKFYNSSADVHSKRLPHLSLLIIRPGRRWKTSDESDLFIFCRLHVPLKSSWECHCDPVLLLKLGSTQRPTVYWPFLLPLDFVVVQLGIFLCSSGVNQYKFFPAFRSLTVCVQHSQAVINKILVC
jgi:hypothetical protein